MMHSTELRGPLFIETLTLSLGVEPSASPTHRLNTPLCFADCNQFHSLENWTVLHRMKTRRSDRMRVELCSWSTDFKFELISERGKLGLENLAQPFSFFSHNESKVLSKRRELCKVSLTLCGFARNYSEDLSGKLSNNSMIPESFPRSDEVYKVL
jgi:hypothetical protein